jgi:TonB family protein
MTDAQTRHNRGLWVIILLVVVFFTLLGLIVFKTVGRDEADSMRPAAVETLIVLPTRIRIRTEPSGNAPAVASAGAGEKLTLLEDQGAWVRVRTSDDLVGWAERASLERSVERERRLKRAENVRKLPPLKGVVSETAALFSGPGIFYTPVGEVSGGARVSVFTRDHDFYAIDHKGGIAYVAVDSVEISAEGTRSVEVATEPEVPTATAPPATASVPPVEPEFEPEPEQAEPPPLARDEPRADRIGVYPSVPPGGTQPVELDRVVPQYPTIARRAGVSGAVVVRGIVRRDGTIDEVEVVKDLPYGLGDAAKSAVRRWRFRPATYRGEPIDVYYTVTVNFRLR